MSYLFFESLQISAGLYQAQTPSADEKLGTLNLTIFPPDLLIEGNYIEKRLVIVSGDPKENFDARPSDFDPVKVKFYKGNPRKCLLTIVARTTNASGVVENALAHLWVIDTANDKLKPDYRGVFGGALVNDVSSVLTASPATTLTELDATTTLQCTFSLSNAVTQTSNVPLTAQLGLQITTQALHPDSPGHTEGPTVAPSIQLGAGMPTKQTAPPAATFVATFNALITLE